MEQPAFLNEEREWTGEQRRLAEYCVECLRRRPEGLAVRCAAEALDPRFSDTVHSRLACAAIVRVGGKMPEHGRGLAPNPLMVA